MTRPHSPSSEVGRWRQTPDGNERADAGPSPASARSTLKNSTLVAVTCRSDWFETARQFAVQPGATLADILDQAGISTDLQPYYDVSINGHTISPDRRHLIRPKTGTRERPVIVTIHPPQLHGGNKGTAKNVLTIVASLALVAGTAFIGAGGLGMLLGVTALQGGIGAATAASPFGVPGHFKVAP